MNCGKLSAPSPSGSVLKCNAFPFGLACTHKSTLNPIGVFPRLGGTTECLYRSPDTAGKQIRRTKVDEATFRTAVLAGSQGVKVATDDTPSASLMSASLVASSILPVPINGKHQMHLIRKQGARVQARPRQLQDHWGS